MAKSTRTTKRSARTKTPSPAIARLQRLLAERLPAYGHRNWIVVADAAYPEQSRPGIQTVVVDADHLAVVRAVLAAVDSATHVSPTVRVDQELAFVAEGDAPGVSKYREQLAAVLGEWPVAVSPHEQIIHGLDQAAQTFGILILKTPLAIPYTSVFFQLECGYWNAGAEQRLRQAIG